MIISSESAFLNAVKNFPKWMDIRKRPRTSTGGKYLQSIIEEQDLVNEELKKYIKDFFLISYIGREEEIMAYGYAAQVGDIDTSATNSLGLTITEDARYFLNNRKTACLLQDGYVVLDESVVPDNYMFIYSYNNNQYSSKLIKTPIWNVFDEFAMMLSLERYPDESNTDLVKRCFLAFKNPTNSTESGIKNTIINALSNYIPLSAEDIQIEDPNLDNLHEYDEDYDTVYERLAQFNKDFFRTKQWDITTWEHNFKTLGYIPNKWDMPLDYYQLGTGQENDLLVKLSDSKDATTDIFVTGYEASQILINEYIHRHNITKEIQLKLQQYKNELIAKNIQYRIKASKVQELDTNKVYFKTSVKADGQQSFNLEDIIIDPQTLTQIKHGAVDASSTYKLVFYPKEEYSSMSISKANLIYGSKKTNLLKENQAFKFKNGILQNIDVGAHVTNLSGLKAFDNIVNDLNGLTVGPSSSVGEFTIDVTGMQNKPLVIKDSCREINYTTDTQFVKLSGFEAIDSNTLTAKGTDSTSNIVIDLECTSLSFEFAAADILNEQGSCSVNITVDDEIDPASGLWSEPQKYSKNFGKFCKVHVEIQKAGMYPVTIKNIMASRYRITRWLDHGELLVTPFATMIPAYNKENALHIKIESFSSYAPVINYVHIGASLKYASYAIDNITTRDKLENYLDIDTDCRVELYKTTNGTPELISKDYTTKTEYRNNTNNQVSVSINVDNFTQILNSSKPINYTTYNGAKVAYITFNPGENLTDILIEGSVYIEKERRSLFDLLSLDKDDTVYICKNSAGFIIKHKNKQEELVKITKALLEYQQATVYSYEGLPENVQGYFIIDSTNNITIHDKQIERAFESSYLLLTDADEYIAYNTETVFQKEIEGVPIVNTFAPLLNMNELMYFEIDEVINPEVEAAVEFIKNYDTKTEYAAWSLGNKELRIKTKFNFTNTKQYGLEASQLKETFVLSNVIELQNEYKIAGKTQELSRFIVTPPDDMVINYDSKDVVEDIIAEEDLFNKLYYSNVTNIIQIQNNGEVIPATSYTLINEAGILIWKDDTYTGKSLKAMYSYKVPVSLSFKSLDSLYEIIGYSTDAYKIINKEPIILQEVKDGDSFTIEFEDNKIPDKMIIKCDNPQFNVVITDKNKITAKLINHEETAMVKTGYYYDNLGGEYYFFEHIHTESIDKMECIELHYVKRTAEFLEFIQASANHVLDTVMTNSAKNEQLCYVDFANQKGIDGISKLNTLTACDVFEAWDIFKMDISFASGTNGLGLQFKSLENSSYALLNISRIVAPNILISFSASETLKVTLMREVKLDGDSMVKSTFVEKFADFTVTDRTRRQYVFSKNINTDYRYYILVQGDGVLDDIIAKEYVKTETYEDIHEKNIDGLGFVTEERAQKSYEHHLTFDVNGNRLTDLEFDGAGTLQTGSNVDWGVTLIHDYTNDFDKCVTDKLSLIQEAFYSNEKTGLLTTPRVYLPNKNAIRTLYIVVNNVLISYMQNLNISIYTSEDLNSSLYYIENSLKSNTLEVSASNLMNYIQVRLEVPPNKVVNIIKVYARYAEEDEYNTPHINTNNSGSFISKLYDTTYTAKFTPLKLVGSAINEKQIDFYIRGYRYLKDRDEFTDWYECPFDNNLNFTDNLHIFPDYRYFQFKIDINNKDSSIKLDEIVLKVVE